MHLLRRAAYEVRLAWLRRAVAYASASFQAAPQEHRARRLLSIAAITQGTATSDELVANARTASAYQAVRDATHAAKQTLPGWWTRWLLPFWRETGDESEQVGRDD